MGCLALPCQLASPERRIASLRQQTTIFWVSYCLLFTCDWWGRRQYPSSALVPCSALSDATSTFGVAWEHRAALESALDGFPDRIHPHRRAPNSVAVSKSFQSSGKLPAKSGTPRRAGGLMSWAASKAVGPMVRRRALRAFFAI